MSSIILTMKRLLILGLVLLPCMPVLAHDMWLIPPTAVPVGQPVEVTVAVGMDFPTSTSALAPERLTMDVVGPGSQSADVSLDPRAGEARTVATFTPTTPGAWVLSSIKRPKLLAQEAASFNSYLLHDGLAHVLEGRMARGETDQDVVEQYSKYVKTVVSVGDTEKGREAARAVLGHVIEIVPVDDPLSVSVGQTLRVRVLYRGQPLQGAALCWDHPGNGHGFTGQIWTDAEGMGVVPVGKSGLMMLRLIHMTRPGNPEYEWESFWASYTFLVK